MTNGRSCLAFLRRTGPALLVLLCGAAITVGCAVQTVKTLSSKEFQRVQTELTRGVSSKADVLRLLGEPQGPGEFGGFHAIRGPEHARKGPLDAWYYDDNRSSGGSTTISQQLRVLIIFFQDDTFDGFLLFSSDATGKMTFE